MGLVSATIAMIIFIRHKQTHLPSHTPTVGPTVREGTPTGPPSTADTVPMAPDRKATPTGRA